MRTVPSPTDRVVVVGAGLAGLSAALRLAGAGREVTVLEREPVPGGRAGRLELEGYQLDTGPTVLTMPDLIADAFASVGEDLKSWLELTPLDPVYRAFFPDGSTLDVKSDPAAMAEEIRATCGPREAQGYARYVEFVSRLYRHEMSSFIDRNLDSPRDLLCPDLLQLAGMGAFRRLAPKIAGYLKDPRTQRVMSFQSMYAGLSPYDALAVYAVISYMDSVAGVFAVKGGMHALPLAMAAAAEKHGVVFRYGQSVSRVLVEHGRAVGVETQEGDRVEADVVVLNPDLPVATRELLPPAAERTIRYSPSCFLLLAGSKASYDKTTHHNIHFGRTWKQGFDELIHQRQLMSDPSLLVTHLTHDDPSLAPVGRHGYSVLVPTPNLDADIDWGVVGPRYRDEVVARLEALGYIGFGESIEVEHVTTPADWLARGMERGTPFAAAHTLFQSGPFRSANLSSHVEGVVFAGSGTTPGVGIPMVLLSGRLAAERIVGAAA